MKKLVQSLFVMLLIASSVIAQDKRITGKVTSKEDGLPLPGVSVTVTGTKLGTQTDVNGSYSIIVPSTAKSLGISFIGFLTQNITIGNRTTINISLENDAKQLSEVIVNGYGTQAKREVTGSVAVVTGKDIENLPVQTFDKALQGRAAGVQVTTNSGQPGSGITVNIRGVATITGSTQPLYIVDGVQISAGGLSGLTTQNVLGSINPADIESIQILKDAASASIYGSQAGNGVVIVTTKRGQAGQTKVRASAQLGVNQELNGYDLLNSEQWYTLQTEGAINRAISERTPIATAVQGLNSQFFGTNTRPATLVNTDWYNTIFRNAKTSQYDLSFSGGDVKTKFFISGSYNGTEGTVIGSDYKRGVFRANLDNKVSDKFSIQSAINVSGSKSQGPSTNQGFFTNTPFTGALFTSPINKVFNDDGSYNQSIYPYGVNLLQSVTEELRETGSMQAVANLGLNYEIVKGLTAKAFGGLDFADGKDYSYRPSTIPIYAPTGGSGTEIFRRNINYNINGTLNYAKTFARDHNFSVLGGMEYRESSGTVLSAAATGFASPLLKLLSSATTYTSETSTFTIFKILSYLGNVRYDYKGKYLFNGNLRYDGSSRFGSNQRFGLFGGASAGWRLTEENFLKQVNWLSDLKLRASYGVTGVQPTGDFQSLNQYQPVSAAAGYNGSGTLRQTVLGNTDLSWENSKQIDLGIDFGFFKNRISGSFEVYQKDNSNLILNVTLPASSGFGSIAKNVGKVKAQGYDFALNTVNLDGKDFKWSTNFNISYTRNKVTELYNGLQFINTSRNYQVGQPLNTFFYIKYAGVNPADGRPMYYDINNNITYNPTDNDRRNLGSSNPSIFGGFGNTLSYKGLSLDVLFQYQYGNEALLQTAQVLEASGAYTDNQVISQFNNRWTTPGQITDTPRPYNGTSEAGVYDPTNFFSRYIQTASYIRLKQVSLNYKLPLALTKRLKLPSVSIYAQGLNLTTFTNYRDQDPETTGNSLNSYPNPRTFTGGIVLDF